MRKSRYVEVATCDGCGVAVDWPPTNVGGAIYCCENCALTGECACPAFSPLLPEALPRRGRSVVRRGPALRAAIIASLGLGDEW